MRLWYLDNEHSSYLVRAETEEEAWTKIGAEHQILPYGSPDECNQPTGWAFAYNPIKELVFKGDVIWCEENIKFAYGSGNNTGSAWAEIDLGKKEG